jgi:hypothetical protein
MAREHLSRFSRGRRGIRNIFNRSYKLRHFLGSKDKKYAIDSLRKHRSGGGIMARPGNRGYRSELEGVYGKWRRDTKDRINKAEARMIKKELEKYQEKLEGDPRHPRTSREYFRRHTHPADRPVRGGPGRDPSLRPGSFGSPDSPSEGPADAGFDGDFDTDTGPVERPGRRDF